MSEALRITNFVAKSDFVVTLEVAVKNTPFWQKDKWRGALCWETLEEWKPLWIQIHKYINTNKYWWRIVWTCQCFVWKNYFLSPGWSRSRHLWPRWPSPNVLACLILNLTQWHPLVAKFINMCHFRYFFRVPRKTWPKSTGPPWKI